MSFFKHALFTAVLAVGAVSLTAPHASAADPDPNSVKVDMEVEKWTLPNGLTVLFHVDHSVPLVSYQQWFRVGSKDEVTGQTGLAHFFEHLMFKGSQKFPGGTFNRDLKSRGANFNAFTTNDYTGYYINAPTAQLEYMIQVEADRMRNLIINEEEIKTEREVVKEELRVRYENSPDGFQWMVLPKLMYQNLPYKWPVIGSMDDLNKASLQDFKNFYDKYYAPNNAIIVVAGHFDVGQAKKWIEKNYGGFKAQDIKRPEFKPEVAQTKPKSETISWKVQSPMMTVAYHTVDIENKDVYALEILGSLLSDGDSSRLYRKLVYEDQLATSASAFHYGQALAGRMIFMISLKKGVSPTTVRKLVEAELLKIINAGVKPAELEKVKTQLLTDQVNSLKSISGRARALAYNELAFADYKRLFSDLEKYRAVTSDDIKRVAQTYLKPQQSNVIIVKPE